MKTKGEANKFTNTTSDRFADLGGAHGYADRATAGGLNGAMTGERAERAMVANSGSVPVVVLVVGRRRS